MIFSNASRPVQSHRRLAFGQLLHAARALVSTLLASLSVLAAQVSVAATQAPSDATRTEHFAAQVLFTADHRQRPFAVVDKRAATITVFRSDGSRVASTPVLIGQAPGDDSMPGVGERTQQGRLRPNDLTTPAGRFDTEPGRHISGERVVWIDYGKALSIHRVRPGPVMADRMQRLALGGASDRRVSAGCVVVPETFFEGVIEPTFGRTRGVVYVMPEDGAWQRLWPALAGAGA